MTDHKFVEDAQVGGRRRTEDGYLVANALCARTGIQTYAGSEVGREDMQVVRVYRPESEVFSRDSLKTYAHRPVTNDHPPEFIDSTNWKKYSVGSVDGEVARDGERVSVPVMLMDSTAIADVEGGKTQTSMGYTQQLEWTAGATDAGEEYDCIARNLRMNHLAIVARGRAGPDVRIGDQARPWGASPITDGTPSSSTGGEKPPITPTTGTDMQTIKKVVDGLTVETTEAGAAAIDRLEADVKTAKDAASTAVAKATTDAEAAKATYDATIAEKDKAMAAKDAEIDKLKSEVLTGADLDKRVADRAALVTKAQAIAKDADFAGKSDLEVKTMTVAASRGPESVADKSEAYIDAMFDLTDVPKGTGDKFRDTMKDRKTTQNDADDNGQSAYQKRISDAWKGEAA